MARVQIFLSTASAEFRSYRDKLRHDLTRPNVSVAIQEDFIVTGTETLDMLDDYIRQCDAVIHLVGDMTGALAQAPSLAQIQQRYPNLGEKLPPLIPFLQPGAPALSYTQWEAWLALYHGKPLIIAVPEDEAPRDERFKQIPDQRAAQQAHLQRLAEVERYPFRFANADRLTVEILRSKLQDILARAGPPVRPANLPFFSLGALFKGREAKVEELARSFGPIPDSNATPVVTRVLSGLGGVGKTRLALEYAWRHTEYYTALLFVGAESGESLQRNLAALCARRTLDLPEQNEREEAKKYEAVLNWLKKTTGWLLILDNVDSKPAAAAAEALLPQLAGGHVLLTSRLTDWSAGLVLVPLDVLTPEAAVDFLHARTEGKRRKQADDPVTARTLADELGRLALALEQAGAYIAQRRLSFDRYLAEWQSQRDKVLAWFDERLMQYPKPVAIAWQTSFDQLTAPSQQFLQRLAWLAPDSIPESLLEVPVPGGEGQADAFDTLAELESYSLVSRAADRPSFSVHRLVQEVTRRSVREEPRSAALIDALHWINTAFAGDPTNPGDWPVLEALLPHARAVARHADAAGVPDPTARLMNQAGLLFHLKAQYAEAEPLYERALAIREQALGPSHPHVATSLDNLALLYVAQGAYVKAEPPMRRALAIFEQALGPSHPDVAQSLNSLASLYDAQGAYVKAEPPMRRALAIFEQALGPSHPDVATSLNNLALLYVAQGAYVKAEPLYERALALYERALGPSYPHVATSLNNLASLYVAQGAYVKAEPLYERALALYEQALGPSHPRVATSLNNLAWLYNAQGAYVKAEPLYERALAIREQALGPNHPDVAQSLSNLASLYDAQGAYVKAEPLYERALVLYEQALGPSHPHVATSLNNLALLYVAQGAYVKAEPLMRRASPVFLGSFGREHPSSRTVLKNYVALLQAMDKTDAEITDALQSLEPGAA